MRDVKNADNRLVAKLDEQTDTIVILQKGYETRIIRKPDGTYEIINKKPAA
jgi:O-methyltransferase involved in polyketide biosynthesis